MQLFQQSSQRMSSFWNCPGLEGRQCQQGQRHASCGVYCICLDRIYLSCGVQLELSFVPARGLVEKPGCNHWLLLQWWLSSPQYCWLPGHPALWGPQDALLFLCCSFSVFFAGSSSFAQFQCWSVMRLKCLLLSIYINSLKSSFSIPNVSP